MKKIAGSLIFLFLLHAVVMGQDNSDDIQPPTLGVNFTLHDFGSAAAIRATSLSSALTSHQFGKIKEMSSGLQITYLNGISRHLDFSGTLGGAFLAYPIRSGQSFSTDHLLAEATASVRGKMTSNNYWLNPYLQAGVGASAYHGYYGAFIPLGAGMQVNLFNQSFLLLNMQYRIPVTQTSNYHFLFSVGFAGKIADSKHH